jgi:putative PIN family toxin of toxin-antitoxin system
MLEAVRAGRFTPIVCPLMQRELTVVLTRPALARRYHIRPNLVADIVLLTSQRGRWIPDPEVVSVCRDPRDDIFIAVAVASNADYIVTRDDDLKDDPAVGTYLAPHGCDAVSVAKFLSTIAP